MLYQPFSTWWCCLRPQERNTLSVLAAMWFVNPTYVERSVYDALVTLTGENSSIKMLEWFELHYGLQYQDIPCGEDCVIHAVVFVGDFWAAMYTFSQTDQFVCAAPCKLLTFPL